MEAKPVRVGLIGCGRVAHNHALALGRCPGARLAAAAGGSKAEAFGSQYGIPVMTTDALVQSPGVDAVLVLTPPEAHLEYTLAALENGKHVLVEKPVSFRVDDIERMRRKAEEKRLVCMPGHSYLYIHELARIAGQCRAGDIGLPTYLYLAETYYMPPELFVRYQGPEYDVLCHELYLAHAFLGQPRQISAFRGNFPKESIPTGGPQVALGLGYAGGAIAQILVSWAAEDRTSDPFGFKVKLLGSQGGMHYSRLDGVRQEGGGVTHLGYQEMFNSQMDWFIHRCIGKGEAPLSTMADAAAVCRAHNGVLQSIRTGSTVQLSKEEAAP